MLEIEITQTDIIDGGIQVFARAWQDGVQIGFGKDGTVDIERFRIFNPPVLVPDELGDVIIISPAEILDGVTVIEESVSRYREDPEEAVLQIVEQAISTSGKDGSNIIAGKVGNTTSTFYTSEDDVVYKQDSADWDITHDATTGSGSYGGGANRREFEGSSAARIFRGFHMFDTSAIADTDDIDSATLSLYLSGAGTDTDTTFACIVEALPANEAAVVVGDYDLCGDAINNPTEGATRIALAGMSLVAYTVFTLDATGRTWIDKTGVTGLGTRNSRDCDDAAPTGDNYVTVYGTAEAGTTKDPKLVVTHSVGGTTYTKTVSSKARVKSTQEKTSSAKARVLVEQTKTVQSKARMKVQQEKTVTAKASIDNVGSATIQAKASVFGTVLKTVTAKAALKILNDSTVSSRGKIKNTIPATVDAKAGVAALVAQTASAKASIRSSEKGIILGRNNNNSIGVGERL